MEKPSLNTQVSIEAVAPYVEEIFTRLFDYEDIDATCDAVVNLYGLLYPGAVRLATPEETARHNAELAKNEPVDTELSKLDSNVKLVEQILNGSIPGHKFGSDPEHGHLDGYMVIPRAGFHNAMLMILQSQKIIDDLNSKYLGE